jgi:hypothetical protein
MENRFVTRELTVTEMIYLSKAGHGDFEAQVLLIESRLIEPIVNLREMTISDFRALTEECMAAVNEAGKVTRSLVKVMRESGAFAL